MTVKLLVDDEIFIALEAVEGRDSLYISFLIGWVFYLQPNQRFIKRINGSGQKLGCSIYVTSPAHCYCCLICGSQ